MKLILSKIWGPSIEESNLDISQVYNHFKNIYTLYRGKVLFKFIALAYFEGYDCAILKFERGRNRFNLYIPISNIDKGNEMNILVPENAWGVSFDYIMMKDFKAALEYMNGG